jgi:hypothetical protein
MATSVEVMIRGGRMDAAGTCVVCGDAVPAGSGFVARSREREFRFKCEDCIARFEADPAPYLAADGARASEPTAEESPASEWACY